MLKYIAFFILPFVTCGAYADDFSDAIANVRNNCANLSDKMEHIKTMAGINTAVTGVGTATAVGATAVGIAKSKTDADLATILNDLKGVTSENNPPIADVLKILDNKITAGDANTNTLTTQKDQISNLDKKSIQLGHARTGLLGASTATNVAGAVIAGTNKIDQDFQARVDDCINSVKALEAAAGQARMDGVDITQAQTIISACGKWKDVDLSKINTKSKAAMISSIVGAGTGLAGTATSAAANTSKIRDDNSATGTKKEQNLNTAANVMAASSAMAGGVATVFNATQISAAKKIVAVAQECEEVLK